VGTEYLTVRMFIHAFTCSTKSRKRNYVICSKLKTFQEEFENGEIILFSAQNGTERRR
jgi:hypothetical protein